VKGVFEAVVGGGSETDNAAINGFKKEQKNLVVRLKVERTNVDRFHSD